MKEELDDIDTLILNKIKKSDNGLNTYELSKMTNISWSTINIHCFRLLAMDHIISKLYDDSLQRKKRIWTVKRGS